MDKKERQTLAKQIDLRSDTVTKPTTEMRRLMLKAEVGDDVYGEDPSVNRLEALAASMLGKEAALFVTSGTQGNQVAIATWVRPGEEVIAEAESHIFFYEAAGVSAIAGAQTRQIAGRGGVLQPTDVLQAIRKKDIHQPRTALICVENTHNRAGGTVTPIETLAELATIARQSGIPVHMDGARLFNAVVASGRSEKEIASHVDSVQVCLSKGLSAPVGSILAGSKEFIDGARVWRKRLGGGLRQAGVLAAPGVFALTNMVDRLVEDHENARHLAEQLTAIPGVVIDMASVQTNIVIVDVEKLTSDVDHLVERLRLEGVLASAFGATKIRFVTHKDVTREDVDEALNVISRVFTERR